MPSFNGSWVGLILVLADINAINSYIIPVSVALFILFSI